MPALGRAVSVACVCAYVAWAMTHVAAVRAAVDSGDVMQLWEALRLPAWGLVALLYAVYFINRVRRALISPLLNRILYFTVKSKTSSTEPKAEQQQAAATTSTVDQSQQAALRAKRSSVTFAAQEARVKTFARDEHILKPQHSKGDACCQSGGACCHASSANKDHIMCIRWQESRGRVLPV